MGDSEVGREEEMLTSELDAVIAMSKRQMTRGLFPNHHTKPVSRHLLHIPLELFMGSRVELSAEYEPPLDIGLHHRVGDSRTHHAGVLRRQHREAGSSAIQNS